jgi:hypothetical protein
MMVWMVLAAWLLALPAGALALSALAARRAARPVVPVEIPVIPSFSLRSAATRGLRCESRRRGGAPRRAAAVHAVVGRTLGS